MWLTLYLIMSLYRKWHLVHSNLIINQRQPHHFNTLTSMLQRFCKILQHNICSYNYVHWILVAQCEWLTYCTSTGFLTANHLALLISSLPIYWSPVSDFTEYLKGEWHKHNYSPSRPAVQTFTVPKILQYSVSHTTNQSCGILPLILWSRMIYI